VDSKDLLDVLKRSFVRLLGIEPTFLEIYSINMHGLNMPPQFLSSVLTNQSASRRFVFHLHLPTVDLLEMITPHYPFSRLSE
jgi:hypothetical protein